MQFSNIYADVENLSNITGQRALVKRSINRALERISGFSKWPFYLDFSSIAMFDDYTTGTADVTNGSATVSGNSTVWTTNFPGRKFRIGTSQAYYTIASRASNTSITLDQPYQGTTATASTYTIFNDEYRLRADADVNHLARQIETGWSLWELDPSEFDPIYPTPSTSGNPYYLIPIGRRQNTYTTGTVSGTVGGTTLTGSSTAWTSELAQGIGRGSRINIGSYNYTVRSVDSATGITIYGTLVATISPGTAYTIFLDNPVVQVYPYPDAQRNIYYRFYRKPAPLENDTDEPDLPPSWQWLLIPGGLIEMWTHKGDDGRVRSTEGEFLRGLAQMKSHYVSSNRVYQRKSQTAYYRKRGPVYPSNFDVRAGAP